MIRPSFILLLCFSAFACIKKTENPDVSDNYVLIEFAARLEEDHYRTSPEPLENYSKKPAE